MLLAILREELTVARKSGQGWFKTAKVMENIVNALQNRLLSNTKTLRKLEDKVCSVMSSALSLLTS